MRAASLKLRTSSVFATSGGVQGKVRDECGARGMLQRSQVCRAELMNHSTAGKPRSPPIGNSRSVLSNTGAGLR